MQVKYQKKETELEKHFTANDMKQKSSIQEVPRSRYRAKDFSLVEFPRGEHVSGTKKTTAGAEVIQGKWDHNAFRRKAGIFNFSAKETNENYRKEEIRFILEQYYNLPAQNNIDNYVEGIYLHVNDSNTVVSSVNELITYIDNMSQAFGLVRKTDADTIPNDNAKTRNALSNPHIDLNAIQEDTENIRNAEVAKAGDVNDPLHTVIYQARKINIKRFNNYAYSDGFNGCLMAVFQISEQFARQLRQRQLRFEPGVDYVAHISTGGNDQRENFYSLCKMGYFTNVHYFAPTDYGGVDTGMIDASSLLGGDRALTGLIRNNQGNYSAEKAVVMGKNSKLNPAFEDNNNKRFVPAGLDTFDVGPDHMNPKVVFNELFRLYGMEWLAGNNRWKIKTNAFQSENFLGVNPSAAQYEIAITEWLTLDNQYLLYTQYITTPGANKSNKDIYNPDKLKPLQQWFDSERGLIWMDLMKARLPDTKYANELKKDNGKKYREKSDSVF